MSSEASDMPQSTDSKTSYDLWFRTKVQQALDDPRPAIPHEQVMSEMNALIQAKLSTHQPD
ncbi:antitoxin [Pseudomonas allii]|uniref:Antitoxin n=2 Tax=Pseudomonas allii TaxID=2740531 RepID=A0ACC6LFW4_9PSED|nr:antitoxin [Pseudomonas allii]MDR9877127.1 antitoxin [Pseudomonas allii]